MDEKEGFRIFKTFKFIYSQFALTSNQLFIRNLQESSFNWRACITY